MNSWADIVEHSFDIDKDEVHLSQIRFYWNDEIGRARNNGSHFIQSLPTSHPVYTGMLNYPTPSVAVYTLKQLQNENSGPVIFRARFLDSYRGKKIRHLTVSAKPVPIEQFDGTSKVCEIFGNPKPTQVTLNNGWSTTRGRVTWAEIPFANKKLPHKGVGHYVVKYQWSYTVSDQPKKVHPLCTTEHHIFIILDCPKFPWTVEPLYHRKIPLSTFPWLSALLIATNFSQSMRNPLQIMPARNKKEAAANIAINFFSLSYLHYNAGSKYVKSFNKDHKTHCDGTFRTDKSEPISNSEYFNLSRLLINLGRTSNEFQVNCDDCAFAIISLANILGCDLVAGDLEPVRGRANGFSTNFYKAIGEKTQCTHLGGPSCSFFRHTVAWTGENGSWNGDANEFKDPNIQVFDACLEFPIGGVNGPYAIAAGWPMGPFGKLGSYLTFITLRVDGKADCYPDPKTVKRLPVF